MTTFEEFALFEKQIEESRQAGEIDVEYLSHLSEVCRRKAKDIVPLLRGTGGFLIGLPLYPLILIINYINERN